MPVRGPLAGHRSLNAVLFSFSKIFKTLVVLLTLFVMLAAVSAQAQEPVGTTSGSLSVSSSGSANYSIPIAVPVGTTGVQPKLALQYDSRAGNGQLGMGWSLTGLSSIARCGTDNYIDNKAKGGIGIDPVDYDDNDKFCLNGQRLMAVKGAYGADGTEYRTYFDSFDKVVSYGTTADGPARFRVWKKSGEIMDYGLTENTLIRRKTQNHIRSWSLSKVSDVKGNYISFTYFNDRPSGEVYITRIDYTGNDVQGLAPYNRVEFLYETRPDPIKANYAGDEVINTKRMTNIRVYAGAALFHDYRFAYGLGASKRSRMTSLTECANATTCFKPTVFNWSADVNPVSSKIMEIPQAQKIKYWSSVFVSGDFNGDGLTDFYTAEPTNTGEVEDINDVQQVFLAKGDGTFTIKDVPQAEKIKLWTRAILIADFNGDGLTDFYTANVTTTGEIENINDGQYIYLSKGDGSFRIIDVPSAQKIKQWSSIFSFGDFNGDGLTDFYTAEPTNTGEVEDLNDPQHVYLSKGDGSFTILNVPKEQYIKLWTRAIATGDFNGDGLTDFYTANVTTTGEIENSSDGQYVYLSNGNGTFRILNVPQEQKIRYWSSIFVIGDFNGDGLTDFYTAEPTNTGEVESDTDPQQVFLSKGDGTFVIRDVPQAEHIKLWTRAIATGDFNGDDLTDFYATNATTTGEIENINYGQYMYLSNGDGSFKIQDIPQSQKIKQWSSIFVSGDFNGDDLTDFYTAEPSENLEVEDAADPQSVHLSPSSHPDVITKITNGHGLASEIVYKLMRDPSVYTKGTGAVYPVQDEMPGGYAVAQIKADNGAGGQNSQRYQYAGLKDHVNGFGSLGFEKMIVTDEATGIKTESVYLQDWANQLHGLLKQEKTIAPNGVVMSQKDVTWAIRGVKDVNNVDVAYYRYSPFSVTVTRDLNGKFVAKITEATTYDAYGYGTAQTVSSSNEAGTEVHSKVTTSTFTHNAASWILGRLSQSTVTHKSTGKPDMVRKSGFTYDTSGLLLTETVEPGHALFHTKTNTYNAFGAVTAITETWGDTANDGLTPTSRTSSFVYDDKVRYRLSETNPLGHTQTYTYDPVLALVTSTKGPNGLTTRMEYDVFGRQTKEIRADNTESVTTREFCSTTVVCPTGGVFRLRSTSSGGGETMAYIDKLAREIRKTARLDGKMVHVDTVYDTLGRVLRKTEPFFEGGTQYWTNIEYDVLGRPVKTTRPDASIQTMVYDGLTETSTNELGQKKSETKDILGRKKVITDNQNQSITYTYDALGQVTSMVGNGKTSSFVYDQRGFKTSDTDPDKGTWTYRTNALGLLVEQTNAKGEVTRMTYDVLGRMLTRIDDALAASPENRTATWVYDTAPNGIGKLKSVSQRDYAASTNYDTLGRPVSGTETIEGNSYTISTSYDSLSRPLTLTYPSGEVVRNVYNANSELIRVENATSAQKYWERLGVDARGNVTRERLGNGVETARNYVPENGNLTGILSAKGVALVQDSKYVFDALGNLKRRTDSRLNQVETFVYDTMNRVTKVDTTVGGTTTSVSMTYGVTGNILSKSDIGTYTYGTVHASCGTNAFAGPHAVTQVAGVKNATYCYDKNGNMTSGDGRVVSYSPFDMPTQIIKGGNTVSLAYGPDRARYKRVDQTVSAGISTTYYIGGKAFERIAKGTEITEKVYIGDFAVLTKITKSGVAGPLKTNYLHKDHLGSVDTITDETGAVIQRMSFDAWGKRREINWQTMAESAITSFNVSTTTRGFTGHEMLDPVGSLVHMNGRVYDAELGRFLSADPFVQDTDNLQSWNRYSYVLNNPLSYTDPSGFFFSKIFKAIGQALGKLFKAIGNAFKSLLRNPIVRAIIQIVACGAAPGIGCAIATGALAAIGGGSLTDALKAAAFSFISAGVWDAVGSWLTPLAGGFGGLESVGFGVVKGVIHGVVGGALSVAQGGTFMEGFASNAIGAFAGVAAEGLAGHDIVAHTAIVAIAGCAGASLSGGKCANGAVTAAFANLYNRWGSSIMRPGDVQNAGSFSSGFLKAIGNEIYDLFFYDDSGPYPTGLCMSGVLCGPGPAFEADFNISAEGYGYIAGGLVSGLVGPGKGRFGSLGEAKRLISLWDKGTFGSRSASITYHASKHGEGDIVKYLRQAENFSTKGANKTFLPDGAIRFEKNGWFQIQRDGKIVSFGRQR